MKKTPTPGPKQTNITKLTLSSTYINRNHVSEGVYTLSYQPNCTSLKIAFLICSTEYMVIKNLNIFWQYFTNISSFKQFHKNRFITKSNARMSEAFNRQAFVFKICFFLIQFTHTGKLNQIKRRLKPFVIQHFVSSITM